MSFLVLCVAAASNSSTIAGSRALMCAARRLRPVRCTRPSANAASTGGYRRATLATWMRLYAASSDRWSLPTQYLYIVRIARGRVQPAPLDLADQRNLPSGVRAVLGDALLEFLDKGFIRKTKHRDAVHAHSSTGAGGRGPTHAFYDA